MKHTTRCRKCGKFIKSGLFQAIQHDNEKHVNRIIYVPQKFTRKMLEDMLDKIFNESRNQESIPTFQPNLGRAGT